MNTLKTIIKQCLAEVFIGDTAYCKRPLNIQARIVEAQAVLIGFAPWHGVHVQKLGIVLQRLETVCKAFGDKYAVAVGYQFHGVPLQESWRAMSDVHRHIKGAAFQTADEFGFRRWRSLEVQAADAASGIGARQIDLAKMQVGPNYRKIIFAE